MIGTLSKAVAAAGTAVPLTATRTQASWATIKAIKTSGSANTGNIYVGILGVSASTGYCLTPGQTVTLESVGGGLGYLYLDEVYIDAGSNADEVKVIYGQN